MLLQLAHMTGRRRAPGATVVGTLAQVAQHLGRVGEHQAVGGAGCLATGLEELVKVEQPLFGGQALDEGKIVFPILREVLPRLGFAGGGEGEIGQAVLVAQGVEHRERRNLLEDARVLAQAEAPQGGTDLDPVEGVAVAAVATGELADDAVHLAQHLIVLPDRQGGLAVEDVAGGEAAVTAGEAHRELEGGGEPFPVGELDDRQALGIGQGQSEMQTGGLGHVASLRLEVLDVIGRFAYARFFAQQSIPIAARRICGASLIRM